MTSEWSQALMITVVGMGLVFLTLLALWGIMAALTRLLRTRSTTSQDRDDHNAKIAAILVALDLYQTEMRREAAPIVREHRPGSLPSRWVAIGRGRQTEGPRRER